MAGIEALGHVADVPLQIEVELDRKVMPISEILQLGVDSVIRMTRSAGENIDLVVGGTLIASGEIVIIEETVGVRITNFHVED